MIEVIDLKDKNIFGLRLDGKFDKEDVKRVFDALIEKVKGKKRFQIYYEIRNFELGSISREMIETEFGYLYKHPEIIANMEKAALVSDVEWLKKIAATEFALIPTMTGKTFSFDEKDEAMKWLRTDQRKQSRMDITFSELAENNVLKFSAGFALGLLAADLFSKNQRKNLGAAILFGTFAAGIPLGIKVLNNNRQLLGR